MHITLHTPATIYTARHVPSWLLLAGAAGFVNGVAFLVCQEFVSHVTGTVTRVGLELEQAVIAAEFAAVYLSFLAGAVTAAVVLQLRARAEGRDRWATPLLAVAGILAGTAAAGRVGAFGPFGGITATDEPPVVLLSLLAFAMGLQNAAVSATTGMAVRTAHLTGPTTDAGLLLGTACLTDGAERRAAGGGAALRIGIVVAFGVGAALALPTSVRFAYLALLAPAAAVLAAAGLSFIPDWSPSDFPFRPSNDTPPPAGPADGMPADAKPAKVAAE